MVKNSESGINITFDNKTIVISSDLVPVFKFLRGIEMEVNEVLNFQSKISEGLDYFSNVLNFTIKLADTLKKYGHEVNNISIKTKRKKSISDFIKDYKCPPLIRSQVILLFSSLEVLFALDIAYKYEVSDEGKIRDHMMKPKNIDTFLNKYILNKNNPYFRSNINNFSDISSRDFRFLRNKLIHFFSIPKNFIIYYEEGKDKQELRNDIKKLDYKVHFLSVRQTASLIDNAHLLRVYEWSEDFINDRESFKRKISFVKSLVTNYGSIIVELSPKK